MKTAYCDQDNERIKKKVELLKIISEENRLKILCILSQYNSICVCKIIENLQLSQSLVSHHLKSLKKVGLVESHKQGLWIHYSLTNKGNRVVKIIFNE